MKTTIPSDLTHIVILDISGIYAQIHNQGYFDYANVQDIQEQYKDTTKWKIVVLD